MLSERIKPHADPGSRRDTYYPMDLTVLWFRNPYYPMDCEFLGYLEVGCFRVECGHPRETLADIFSVGQSHVSNGCQWMVNELKPSIEKNLWWLYACSLQEGCRQTGVSLVCYTSSVPRLPSTRQVSANVFWKPSRNASTRRQMS